MSGDAVDSSGLHEVLSQVWPSPSNPSRAIVLAFFIQYITNYFKTLHFTYLYLNYLPFKGFKVFVGCVRIYNLGRALCKHIIYNYLTLLVLLFHTSCLSLLPNKII